MSKTLTTNPALSRCSIARTLDIIGEKWTLLILRDLWRGLTRFTELEANLKCPRNLLSKRLQTLESHGIVIKTTYKEEKSRTRMAYQLTQPGRDLLPVLIALQNWGDQHLPAVAGQVAAPTDPQCGGRLITQITCANGHAVNL